MSVSPDDLSKGLGRGPEAPHDDDVTGHWVLPAPAPARRRLARGGAVALGAAVAALSAGAAAAAGVVPAPVRDAVDTVTDTVRAPFTRTTVATPSPTPVVPQRNAVGVLLDRAASHLDAGRLEPASAALTTALRRLESLPVADRSPADVERYDALRARLRAAVDGGAGVTGKPSAKPAKPAPEHPSKAPRTHGKGDERPSGQPSRDASAKPRA